MPKRSLPIKTTYAQATKRSSFCLTYVRDDSKHWTQEGMDGELLDDAFKPGERSTGEWIGSFYPLADNKGPIKDDWVRKFFREAIAEVIHEGLEWMQVDGQPVLNPHGEHDDQILTLSKELADNLYDLSGRGRRAVRVR